MDTLTKLLMAASVLLVSCHSEPSGKTEPDPEPVVPGVTDTGSLLPENITFVARVTGRSQSGENIPDRKSVV